MTDQITPIPFDPDFDSNPSLKQSSSPEAVAQVSKEPEESEKSLVVKFNLDREAVFDILTLVILGSTIYFGWSIYNLIKLVS